VSRVAITGLLLLIALLSGVWLSRNLRLNDPRPSGKPLAGVDAAVHKLSALAMGIIAGVTIRNLHRGIEFRSMELTAAIVAGLVFVLMVVSGSLLSLGKARNDEILTLHKVGSLLTVIITSWAIYLLTRGRW
jgi:Ni/Fe-hydrogenase subunit HybB-like protein